MGRPYGGVVAEAVTKIQGDVRSGRNPHYWYSRDTDAEGQFREDHPWFDRVRHLIHGIPPATVVLDVGCNTGGLGRRLSADLGCYVVGVDLARHLLPKARENGYVSVVHADAESLPFRCETFPVVVLSEILEHVENPVACVTEVARILMPGGWLLGDVPTWFGKWGYRSLHGHKWHVRAFWRRHLQDLLSMYFRVEYIRAEPRLPTRHFLVPQWFMFKAVKVQTSA